MDSAASYCSILRVLIFVPFKKRYGGIAQLGEHLLCKQGVSGSIPLISTNGPNRVCKMHLEN